MPFRRPVCRLASALLSAWTLTGCAVMPLAPEDKAVLLSVAELDSWSSSTNSTAGSQGADSPLSLPPWVSSAVAAHGAVKAGLGLADLPAWDDSARFRYRD